MRTPAEKIVGRDALAQSGSGYRRRRAVLANGLFDLVHVGHARYLQAARETGEQLVVALNSDASARRYKGPSRPLISLTERMELIASFRCVDFVTWFDEDTVAATLRALGPAFHAKGRDYRPENLPEDERETHIALGIEVVIVGDPKDHATTDIIRRVERFP